MVEETGMPKHKSTADPDKLGYVGRHVKARDSGKWYTPADYAEAARAALGGTIDLDPFSDAHANRVIRAGRYYDEETDAFAVEEWDASPGGRLFMNPPYGQGIMARCVEKLLEQFENGNFARAVVLANNATDTKWFSRLTMHSKLVCFTDHRISFWNEDGKATGGNTRGQAFFLMLAKGEDTAANRGMFRETFAPFGNVFSVLKPKRERNHG